MATSEVVRPYVNEKIERSIPSYYYFDPDHYKRELEAIWYRRWLMICRAEDIPAPRDYCVFTVGQQNVVVTRDLRGKLRAFHNTCRHRGSILCTANQGRFDGGSIVCPYHAWTYSLEGDLIATPHQLESADFDMADYSLYDVAIGEWGGFVFINLAGRDAEPLEAALGGIPERHRNFHVDRLRLGHREVIDVEANWKLLFENFAECFHCPQVHPELCSVVPLYGRGLNEGEDLVEWQESGGESLTLVLQLAEGAVTFTMDGTTGGRPMFRDTTEEERADPYTGGIVRPNLFINTHPDFIHTHRMLPTGPTSVQMTYEWFFEPETLAMDNFNAKQAYELWDITNRQDARNCEWQQAGLFSNRHEYSVFVPQERGPFNFNQWVLRELGEPEN